MKIESQFDLTKLITDTQPKILGLSSNDKLVLLCICHFMDKSFSCYPSIDKLVTISGLSKSTVSRSINTIVDSGVLIRKNRYIGNAKTSNLYKLDYEILMIKLNINDGTINKEDSKVIIDKTNKCLAPNGKIYDCIAYYFEERIKESKNQS